MHFVLSDASNVADASGTIVCRFLRTSLLSQLESKPRIGFSDDLAALKPGFLRQHRQHGLQL